MQEPANQRHVVYWYSDGGGEYAMRCGSWIGIAVVVAGAAVLGCDKVDKVDKDKADADYQTCTQRKTNGFVEAAVEACKAAVEKDASSKSGKAAAQLLLELEPVAAKRKAEVAAAQQKGAQAAVARLASLKAKVQRRYSSSLADAYCTGKGLPPYLWDYTGGTFAEDAALATSEGCASLFPGDPSNFSFCCSRKPGAP